MDWINRQAWASSEAIERFRGEGWTDPGERAALASITDEMRGKRLLDIGVGAGRSLPLMTAISDDYTALDYTPELVEECRARHPGRRVEHMDARDLSAFGDASFDMAMFSYNGIDAVAIDDRARILGEVRRVLMPGGVFLFSTHNQAGYGCGEKPWSWYRFTPNPLKLAKRTAVLALTLSRDIPGYLRNRRYNRHHDGYSVMVAAAHHFGIVIVYMNLEYQRQQLAEAGFDVEAVYSSEDGALLPPGADTSDIWWFHIVARRRS